jgi:hypothetical protein
MDRHSDGLGAQKRNVLTLVMKEGALLVLAGTLGGLALAWAGIRALSSLFFTAASVRADDLQRAADFLEKLRERTKALPGVTSVCLTDTLPAAFDGNPGVRATGNRGGRRAGLRSWSGRSASRRWRSIF